MITALLAAERRLAEIRVDELIGYVRAWSSDVARWRAAVRGLPTLNDLDASVDYLGLAVHPASGASW